jgi:hypothetical protein
MKLALLSTCFAAALPLLGCSGSDPKPVDMTMPTQLASCPFGSGAGNGILMSPALVADLDSCSQNRALCAIRVDVPCASGAVVITEWACDCTNGKWHCDVSGRNPFACPDGGST